VRFGNRLGVTLQLVNAVQLGPERLLIESRARVIRYVYGLSPPPPLYQAP
jgi:hypothetical protein